MGSRHSAQRADQGRAFVLFIPDFQEVRFAQPGDINDAELLIRKLIRDFCHSISQQKTDADDNVERPGTGRVLQIRQVVRSGVALNLYQFYAELLDGFVCAFKPHIVK